MNQNLVKLYKSYFIRASTVFSIILSSKVKEGNEGKISHYITLNACHLKGTELTFNCILAPTGDGTYTLSLL